LAICTQIYVDPFAVELLDGKSWFFLWCLEHVFYTFENGTSMDQR
jgi:hypothetical protein